MSTIRTRCRAVAVALAALLLSAGAACAQPAPREAWWWTDELREVAFALGIARTGRVSQWPRLTVAAGAAALPLPPAAGQVTCDGRLDEPAWAQATALPVGPVFGPWREGPFTLQVMACRDEKAAYLAISAPCDLRGLASLREDRALFVAGGRPYRPDAIEGGMVVSDGAQTVIEVAIPRARPGEPLEIVFHVELVRLVDGRLPPDMAAIGLGHLADPARRTHRKDALWLEPVRVTLTPSDMAVRAALDVQAADKVVLSHEILAGGKVASRGEAPLSMTPPGGESGAGVFRYEWKAAVPGGQALLEGFAYVPPVVETLAAAREIAARGPAGVSQEFSGEAARIEGAAAKASPADRAAWRTLYAGARVLRAWAHLALLDAPLLVVKQHPYYAGHIYDDYYTWHPGGGIYVVENPADADAPWRVRPVIDAGTAPTLGGGVYRDADLSWDARRVVFACKPAADAMTSLYEIGADGAGLRRLTESDAYHDITPAYLPDGRIVFTSTRPKGRVPCFNSGVDTLHTLDPATGEIRSISSNNVNEFDPAVLPDGRILYGRWEYVDKTALYMQSLWTVLPDGTQETALFGNNLPRPTAILDALAVPGTTLVAASLTPHNGQAVGAIALIDPALGKNNLAAITNLTPEYPAEMDQGLMVGPCDPQPLSAHDVLYATNAIGGHGVVELADRAGRRELAYADARVSCFAPALVRPRLRPPVVTPVEADNGPLGRFLVQDVYEGLPGVKRGEVKRLRVVEETARTSEVPPGGRWWNQAFLVSWQGAYVIKTVLGTVPVEDDGSAYFEAPPGRALYFEALDADGREVQRMRTFVQAVPGTTRACVGCHEAKLTSPPAGRGAPRALARGPSRPEAESWGTGFVDFPTMIQPILDKHCVRCHGGPQGMGGGVDLSGGWTWAFNIAYETLLKHNLVGFIRCLNEDTTSARILPPRTAGSGAAPLGELLVGGHQGRIPDLTRAERDLVMAWMDTNSNYYGTWDYTPHATCAAVLEAGAALAAEMRSAGCTKCHDAGHVGNDWINLQTPEHSRILRAPLAGSRGGLGLAWCRDRKAPTRLRQVTQRDLPPDVFRPPSWPKRDASGEPVTPFASPDDPRYQAMLAVIRRARTAALAQARVDMPGARPETGVCRIQTPLPLPDPQPAVASQVSDDGAVELAWPRDARTIGLQFEVHRGAAVAFEPSDETRLARFSGFRYTDMDAPAGEQHYAVVFFSGPARSAPVRLAVTVPAPIPPLAPQGLTARGEPGQVALEWQSSAEVGLRYHVYRGAAGAEPRERLTGEPLAGATFFDTQAPPGVPQAYSVRAVSRRGVEGPAAQSVTAAAQDEPRGAVFAAEFERDLDAILADGQGAAAQKHGAAAVSGAALDLARGGHVTFAHRSQFDLAPRLTVSVWVRFAEAGQMPVIASCGRWQGGGWFLQRLGGAFRWHVGGVDCDGGAPAVGRWMHLVGTFDGRRARLFQDGRQVADVPCAADTTPWNGPLFVGQYGAAPGLAYQVTGRIARLRLYRRAMGPGDVGEAFREGPPR